MWPCEYTAVCRRSAVHVRTCSCTARASGREPVSTSTSPSAVANALTLANEGTKATPPVTSSMVPRLAPDTGWTDLTDVSPRHSLSARPSTAPIGRSVGVVLGVAVRRSVAVMKFGIAFANTGHAVTPEGATALATIAEDLGYESLWTVEHVVVPADYESTYPYSSSGRMPGTEDAPIPDPLVWL